MSVDLIGRIGGPTCFGFSPIPRSDDPAATAIDLRPNFGSSGVKFGSVFYDSLYLNNNGAITFGDGTNSYTPSGIESGVTGGT